MVKRVRCTISQKSVLRLTARVIHKSQCGWSAGANHKTRVQPVAFQVLEQNFAKQVGGKLSYKACGLFQAGAGHAYIQRRAAGKAPELERSRRLKIYQGFGQHGNSHSTSASCKN